MPRRPRNKGKVENACYQAWMAKRASILNRAATVKEVFEKDVPKFLSRCDREDWPELSWVTKRFRYKWEPNSLSERLQPDPIIEAWDKKLWKLPRKISVLTRLYDQASLAVHWYQRDRWDDSVAREFNGLTERICDWAWKLSEFFNLNVSCECYLLILIANFLRIKNEKTGISRGQLVAR